MADGVIMRQIRDLGSNPGSRVGSHKANTRVGDQTTIIKKQVVKVTNQVHAAPDRFKGSDGVKGAPKIGMVIPAVSKGMISSRNGMHTGSASRVIQGSTTHGSQGAIKTAHPLGAQVRPKKGSCNAVIQRGKGQVNIHENLEGPQAAAQKKRDSSRKNLPTENIPTEECRENRAYKVKHVLDSKEGRHSGH